MIAPIHPHALPAAPPSISKPAVIASALLIVLTTVLAWIALGSTLQFLIASLLLSTLAAPLLQSVGRRVLERTILMQTCGDAIATVWLIVFLHAGWGIGTWLVAYLLLIGWNATIGGLAMLLRWRAMPAIAVIVGVGILGWPILLGAWSGESAERLAAIASTIHPVFALHPHLTDLGAWTHQPLSYQLMSLGQDVPFALPSSAWPAVATWVILGALLLTIAIVCEQRGQPQSRSRSR